MNSKPNILLLASDEHNAAVSGYAGDRVIETPALDARARARWQQPYFPE